LVFLFLALFFDAANSLALIEVIEDGDEHACWHLICGTENIILLWAFGLFLGLLRELFELFIDSFWLTMVLLQFEYLFLPEKRVDTLDRFQLLQIVVIRSELVQSLHRFVDYFRQRETYLFSLDCLLVNIRFNRLCFLVKMVLSSF
jgi:hypothetical protein